MAVPLGSVFSSLFWSVVFLSPYLFVVSSGWGVENMSADKVARLCKALSLKEKEGPLMPLQVDLKTDGVKRMGFRLIGKLISNKLVNRDAFTSLFPRIWRTMEDFEIEVLSGNTFSFTFKSANDRWQVLQGGPWSFDKALLVLEEPTGNGDIQGMKFNRTAF